MFSTRVPVRGPMPQMLAGTVPRAGAWVDLLWVAQALWTSPRHDRGPVQPLQPPLRTAPAAVPPRRLVPAPRPQPLAAPLPDPAFRLAPPAQLD